MAVFTMSWDDAGGVVVVELPPTVEVYVNRGLYL